jgi:hypothetical protein
MTDAQKTVAQMPVAQILALLDLLLNRPCLTRKDLAMRYGKDTRTIDRYKADGTLPPPKYFHGPLWTPAQIAAAENAPKLKRISKKGDGTISLALQKDFQF